MTTGADIMRLAGILLQDEQHIRWTPPELCLWINEGQKAIALAKPSAKSASRVLTLQAGARQSVTIDAGAPSPTQLLDILCNVRVASPRADGRAVKPVSGKQLDAIDPHWRDTSRTRPTKEVRHFVYDEQNPLEFLVYPPNDGTGLVEALCAVVPTLITEPTASDDATAYTDEIDLIPVYDPILVDYVVYRCQIKDATNGDPGRAVAAFQSFANALGIKIQVEGASSPNSRRASA